MPSGGSQYMSALGSQGAANSMNNATANDQVLQKQWGNVNQQYQNAVQNSDVLSPQFQNELNTGMQGLWNQQLQNVNQAYNQKNNISNFKNANQFGGINNSVGRDMSLENQAGYNQQLGQMNNKQFLNKQEMQNDQLNNQNAYLKNIGNYQDYIDNYNTNTNNMALRDVASGMNTNGQIFNPNYRSAWQNIAGAGQAALGIATGSPGMISQGLGQTGLFQQAKPMAGNWVNTQQNLTPSNNNGNFDLMKYLQGLFGSGNQQQTYNPDISGITSQQGFGGFDPNSFNGVINSYMGV